MNKVLKRILLGLGGLLLLLVIGVAVLFVVIDPNDYRSEIAETAYKATGRKIELKGDIGLKIIPRLGFSIKDVFLAQATGFGDAPLAHVQELSLSMAIMPLFKGKIEVDAISLNGLSLALLTDSKGRNNWDVPSTGDALARPATTTKPATSAKPTGSAQGSAGTGESGGASGSAEQLEASTDAAEAQKNMEKLAQSSISSVEIRDFTISYKDARSKEYYLGRINELTLGNVGLNRNISCVLDAAAEVGSDTKAGLTLNGQLRYELSDELISFNFKSFAISAIAPQLQGKQEIKGKLSGSVNAKTSAVNVNLALDSAFMNGTFDVALAKDSMQGIADLKSSPLTLLNALSPAMKKQLALPPELLDAKSPLRSLDLKLAFSQAGKKLSMNKAELRLGGSDFVASIPLLTAMLNDAGTLASAQGSLSLRGSLRPILPLAGINPKGNSFSKLDSSLNFKFAGNNLTLTAFKLKLDDALVDLAVNKADIRLSPVGPLLPINSLTADLNIAAKPRQLMNDLDIQLDTADPKVLAEVKLALNLAVDNSSLKINNLKGQLDDTSISALVELLLPGAKGIPKGSNSFAKLDLQIGNINIDRYLPPESAGAGKAAAASVQEAPAAQAQTGAKAMGGPLKGSPLEKTTALFSANIKSLTVKKVPVQNISMEASLVNGVLTVSRAVFNTFEGQFNLSAKADLVNKSGAGALKASLKNINIGTALLTVLDEKRLSGKADLNADLAFKGIDTDAILATLNGKGNIKVRDGVLKDFQLIPENAPQMLLKHRLSDYRFSELGGSFVVVDGKLINNDLAYKDKNLGLTGKGSVMLVNRNVDYKAVLKTKETGEIPLRIEGPLNSPKLSLDQEALAKMAAGKATDKALQDLQKKGIIPAGKADGTSGGAKQDVTDKVNKEIGRGLEKLFKK